MKEKIYQIISCGEGPIGISRLCSELDEQPGVVEAALRELAEEGRILVSKKGKAGLPSHMGLVYGRVQRSPKGFAFFIPEEQGGEMFLSREDTNGALHGDMVWARQIMGAIAGEKARGQVVIIASRKSRKITGRFERMGRMGGYVIPDDPRMPEDLFIPASCMGGASGGEQVVAEITQYPSPRRNMVGKITEVLGLAGEKGVDILSIIRSMELPDQFPKSALEQAASLRPPQDEDMKDREDLRELLTITIDGADAKDLDDAVSLARREDGGYTLWVHIADVAHYVRAGSPIDREAYRRGTSVYFPDRVLPMLPKELSNGLCSLNPGEDKLTMTCRMELNSRGRVISKRIFESVIKSDRRMTYDDVNAIFHGDEKLRRKYLDILPMLEEMHRLMGILRARRIKRGSIDFDLPETGITLNEAGEAVEVYAKVRGDAEKLIEEFMLLANESVACHGVERNLPLMYRVHNAPDPQRMKELNEFLGTLGYSIRSGENVTPGEVQKLIDGAKGTPEETVVSRVTLRAMTKAKYAPECTGHFGLATSKYLHFTSPIRRYPDLVVHRVIKESIRRRMRGKVKVQLEMWMPAGANHCSEREIAAAEAERAGDSIKKCQYMTRHIGEESEGIISGVSHSGFFVELPNTVEGMVRSQSLNDDYYIYDERNYRLVGRSSGRQFRLGDRVRVRAVAADMESGNIEFRLCGEEMPGGYRMAYRSRQQDMVRQEEYGAAHPKRHKDKKSSRRSTKGKNGDRISTNRSHSNGGKKGGSKKRHTQARRKPKSTP